MPRYELSDGKSNKFWEIEVNGDSYTVCYGKIGTNGQSTTKSFNDEEQAKAEADKITATKVKKGYVLVGQSKSTAGKEDADAVSLEQAIHANPQDNKAWQAYADWLNTKNDPYGELISLSLSSKDGKRLKELNQQIQNEYLGEEVLEIDNKKIIELDWLHGFIKKARVSYEYDFDGPDTEDLLSLVLKKPIGQFMQELVIGITSGMEDGDADFSTCLRLIAAAGKKASLKRLIVGDFDMYECEISWSSLGDAGKIYAVLPNLEYLKFHGGSLSLGKLQHKKLKQLVIETGGLPADSVKSIAKADLPSLESLEVWFGSEDYGAEGNIKMLAPLFDGEGYPSLRHLGLQNSEFENDIAKKIVTAKILPQLTSLDLSMGTMTDEGAQALLDHADSLKHLSAINVEDNFISKDMVKKLEKAFGKKINIGDQEAPDEYDGELFLYVSVGE